MIRKWLVFFLCTFFLLAQPSAGVVAQTDSPGPDRVLLFGDSWAGLMWEYKTYQQVFDEHGFPDVGLDGSLIGDGGTARSWSQPESLALLSAHLTETPSLDTVVISLGGNDLLGTWHTQMDPAEEQRLLAEVWQDLLRIIETVLDARPGIEVLLMGYDYSNFVETRERDQTGRTMRLWQQLGRPDPAQANQIAIRLARMKLELAESNERVFFVQAFGLMQSLFGYPDPPDSLGPGFEPFSVPFPGQAESGFDPFPGGDPNYPSPPAAMANQGSDPIHLNKTAYHAIAALQMQAYFERRLRGEPAVTLEADPRYSGWVRSDGAIGESALIVGDEVGSSNYRALLSFNTAPIHRRARITHASLYLVRDGDCCGENPFLSGSLGAPRLDLASGSFGELHLEPSDFSVIPGQPEVGIFHGSVREGGYILRIDLSPQALQAIDKHGWTQLRISFPEDAAGAGTVQFFLAGDSAPRLEVFYEPPSFSLLDIIDPDIRVAGLPMPVLTISLAMICLVTLVFLAGAALAARKRRD